MTAVWWIISYSFQYKCNKISWCLTEWQVCNLSHQITSMKIWNTADMEQDHIILVTKINLKTFDLMKKENRMIIKVTRKYLWNCNKSCSNVVMISSIVLTSNISLHHLVWAVKMYVVSYHWLSCQSCQISLDQVSIISTQALWWCKLRNTNFTRIYKKFLGCK